VSIYTKKEPLVLKEVFRKYDDTRGFLSALDLKDLGLPVGYENFHYQLLSYTENSYTFRGFHFQDEPFEQDKLIFIHTGRVIDIIFPTNLKVLDDVKIFDLCSGDALYLPKGYAHGFISVCKNVVLQYLMDNPFSEGHYAGISGIKVINLFREDCMVSDKDSSLPRNVLVEQLVGEALTKWLAKNRDT